MKKNKSVETLTLTDIDERNSQRFRLLLSLFLVKSGIYASSEQAFEAAEAMFDELAL